MPWARSTEHPEWGPHRIHPPPGGSSFPQKGRIMENQLRSILCGGRENIKEQKEISPSWRIWGFCCVWRGERRLREGCTQWDGTESAVGSGDAALHGVYEHSPLGPKVCAEHVGMEWEWGGNGGGMGWEWGGNRVGMGGAWGGHEVGIE